MTLALLLLSTALAAGPTGPGVTVKYLVPPPTLVKGVTTLEVQPFSGRRGEAIAAEIVLSLADPERMATDTAAVTREILKQGKGIAGDLASSAVGGGIQGKVAKGVTKTAVGMAEDRLDIVPLQVDDGLRINVFEVVPTKASATLGGTVKISEKTEDFKRTETKRNSDGQVVTDGDGKPVKIEVSCRRRSVTAAITWTVNLAGNVIATDQFERKGGDSRCGSEMSQLTSANDIADQMLVGAGVGVVRRMAPSWKVKRLPLTRSKNVKEPLKSVRDEDWSAALCGFHAAAQSTPDDYASVHGYAVMLEAYGHFDAAREAYKGALEIKSTKMGEKSMNRAAKHKVQTMILADTYAIPYTVADQPDLSSCP